MGRKNKIKNERKFMKEQKELDKLLVIPYTFNERTAKINNIMMDLIKLNMEHALSGDILKQLYEFKDNGTGFDAKLELPEYSRTLVAQFENDKNKDKENSINFIFKKIRIDGVDDNNPIHKLNMIQETLLD